MVDEPGVDQEEVGESINLADELLAQLEMRDQGVQGSAVVPEEAVDTSGSASPQESHHEHHSSLGTKLKDFGHDVKEAVKDGVTGGDKRPNRQQARKVSTTHPYQDPYRHPQLARAQQLTQPTP